MGYCYGIKALISYTYSKLRGYAGGGRKVREGYTGRVPKLNIRWGSAKRCYDI